MRCGVDPMNVLDSNCVLHTHTHTQQRCFIRLCVSPRNAEDAGISRSTGIDGKKRWNKCRLRLQIVRRMNASALIFADWTGHDARQRVCRRKDALSFGISDTFFGNSILIYFIRSQVRRQRHTSHGDERKEKLFFFFFHFLSSLSLSHSLVRLSGFWFFNYYCVFCTSFRFNNLCFVFRWQTAMADAHPTKNA